MSRFIKKAWHNPIESRDEYLYNLSLESSNTEAPLNIDELFFPSVPTPDNPQRHVINFGLLTFEDLIYLERIVKKAQKHYIKNVYEANEEKEN